MLRLYRWALLGALSVGLSNLGYGADKNTPAPAPSGKAEITDAEYQLLQKEVEALRKKLAATTPISKPTTAVDDAIENKYGPNAKATSKNGRVQIGGMMQVWYYSIANDNHNFLDTTAFGLQNSGLGSNEVADNDSFRVRRAELKFTADVTENIRAVIMIDPAREATSYPTFPSNQGSGPSGDGVALYDYSGSGNDFGNAKNEAMRAGTGDAARLLQDAYIQIHSLIPHHDVSVGQMKRRLGEEGYRSSGELDFVERGQITQLADLRDLGLQVHGTWWSDRFQYWGGVFDGAGTAFQQRQNRSDDNDAKDWLVSALVRPIWKDETWGNLELGYSILQGRGGEGGSRNAVTAPTDGLNRASTVHSLQYAWAMYKPGGPARGLWFRGEWGQYRDRFAPGTGAVSLNQPVVRMFPNNGGNGNFVTPFVNNPGPFNVQGWVVSGGFKLADSRFEKNLNKWVKPMEFTFRYDKMWNLFYPDLVNPQRNVDVFDTTVYTAGINYYIKGHNAKIQANYNWVMEDDQNDHGARQLREVRNNSFVLNFQVVW